MPNPVATEIYDVFRRVGATHAQAIGILANVSVESGFDPRAVGDHGQARGLVQMHADRRAAILRGCGINMATASAVDQARGIIWQLQHRETGAWHAIQRAATPAAAAACCQFYERPGDLSGRMAVRERIANELAREFA